MISDKEIPGGSTTADDNVSNNAEYDTNGNIKRTDDRDKKDSTEDWNAELSRTGRHR